MCVKGCLQSKRETDTWPSDLAKQTSVSSADSVKWLRLESAWSVLKRQLGERNQNE